MKRLAPNGKVSNLTTEQWKLVRTPAFKAWFGDWENSPETASKVVDENGEPLVVYHNPSYGDCDENVKYPFTVFDIEQKFEKTRIDTPSGRSFYFALDLSLAGFFSNCSHDVFLKKVYRCFLNVRNPSNTLSSAFSFDDLKNINLSIKNTKDCDGTYLHNYDLESAIEDGWDGIGDADQIIVFNSNQIKLADGSNTTFDSSNPDIRFGDGGKIGDKKFECIVSIKAINTKSAENKCLKYIPTFCHTPIKFGKGRIYNLETTMYFNSEDELLNYFKGLKNKGIELFHFEEVNKKEDSNEMEKGGDVNESKFEYTLSNPYKNVFLLEMPSQYDLASTFAKCQAFYEWDDFKGKKFKIDDYYKWFSKEYPELKTYQEEFYGFNLPSDVIDECYKVNDERTEYDNFFLKIISEIKEKHDDFYIIGAVTGDKNTIDHEIAHSFFWRFRMYKNKMKQLVDELPNRDKFFSILSEERGYGKNVLYDEVQAFMSTGLITNISEWEQYREPFIKMFNRQKYISTTKAIERASKKYRQKRYGTTEQRKEHYEKYQKDWKKENKEHLTEYQRKHRKDYPSYKKRLEKLRSPEFKQKFREKYFMDKHGSLDKMKELDERKNKRKKDKIEKEHEVSKLTNGEGDVYIHPFLGDVRMYEYGEKYSLVFVHNPKGNHPIIKRVQTRVLVKK